MHKRLIPVLLFVCAIVAVAPATASAQQTFNFSLGVFTPRGEDARVAGDVLNENRNFLFFEIGDFKPYVTGGLGSFVSEAVVQDVTVGTTRIEDRRRTTDFATNIGAGVNYRFTDWAGIGADYRTFFVHRDDTTPRVHRFTAGLTLSLK